MRLYNASVAVAILLIVPFSVKAAEPAGSGATEPPKDITLMLDQGFVGRPVSLELFDKRFRIEWDNGTLVKPTSLRITEGQAVTGTEQIVGGTAYKFEFANADAVSGKGVFRIKLRAHRPPLQGERPELNASTSSAAFVSNNAVFYEDSISGSVAAAPVVSVTPVWYDGIMRQGFASWYSYKKCLCAASPDVPKGTRMLVSREDDPSRWVVVTVNDWGPERDKHPDRAIDLDKVAFKRIGNPRGGLMRVRVEVLPQNDPRWKLGDELPPPNWKKLRAALEKALPAVSR